MPETDPAPLSGPLGETEVHDDDAPGAGEHDVLGFDIAVDEPGLVDGLEPGEELRGDVLGFFQLERPALLEHAEQRRPVDVLHGDQLAAVDLDEVEDPADVGRDHLAGGPHLLAQHLQPPLGLEELIPERLEPDLDPQLEIEGAPDLAHPTATEHLEDLVPVAQHLTGGEETRAPPADPPSHLIRLGAGRQRLVRRRSCHPLCRSRVQIKCHVHEMAGELSETFSLSRSLPRPVRRCERRSACRMPTRTWAQPIRDRTRCCVARS